MPHCLMKSQKSSKEAAVDRECHINLWQSKVNKIQLHQQWCSTEENM